MLHVRANLDNEEEDTVSLIDGISEGERTMATYAVLVERQRARLLQKLDAEFAAIRKRQEEGAYLDKPDQTAEMD